MRQHSGGPSAAMTSRAGGAGLRDGVAKVVVALALLCVSQFSAAYGMSNDQTYHPLEIKEFNAQFHVDDGHGPRLARSETMPRVPRFTPRPGDEVYGACGECTVSGMRGRYLNGTCTVCTHRE